MAFCVAGDQQHIISYYPESSIFEIRMKGVIYKYTFPNGKVYIGQTKNPIQRKIEHTSASSGKRNVAFWRAYKKYGSFEYEEIITINKRMRRR